MTHLLELMKKAETLGVRIDAQIDDFGWGYWLLKNDGSGDGIWADDNFCTSCEEIAWKLEAYEAEER